MSFHINSAGDAGKCSARKGRCPFGAPEEHFDSIEAARASFEKEAEVARPSFFGRSKRAEAKAIPETYAKILNSRGVETYSIGLDLVNGDTILTKQGRLYRVLRTTDYQAPYSEQEKFELMELDPKTGKPLDGRKKPERGFKDDFSASVLVIDYNESVKLKKQWLKDEATSIKNDWTQLFKEQSENSNALRAIIRANPKIDEDVPRHERATQEAARDAYRALDKKSSAFEQRRFALSERERFFDIEETNYVLAKRRRPYSLAD